MLAWVEDADRGNLERAWVQALLQRMDAKKFPKKPSDLFASEGGDRNELLVAQAKRLKVMQDKRDRQKAKGLKVRDATILREE